MIIPITIIILIIIFFIFTNGYIIVNLLNHLYKLEDNGQLFYSTDYKWCKKLRKHYKTITQEFLEFQKLHNLPTFGDISSEQKHLADNQKEKWKVAVLKFYNQNTDLIDHFPKTIKLINKIPNCTLAMFSILEPYKCIPPHIGDNKGILRYHLALITPKKYKDCFINLHTQKYHWKTGQDIIFDDTFVHSVQNNTNEPRVVLFLDIKKQFQNPFLNLINNLLLILAKYNNTVKQIIQNINANSLSTSLPTFSKAI